MTPLTTYTYTTASSSLETVSATDEERLPPGGFSLRHGFPQWFGRASKSMTSSTTSSRDVSNVYVTRRGFQITHQPEPSASRTSSPSACPDTSKSASFNPGSYQTSIIEVLQYLKNSFDECLVLDGLPRECAGNLGAWDSWQAHRNKNPRVLASGMKNSSAIRGEAPSSGHQLHITHESLVSRSKEPHDWSWDGIWEKRVRDGIDISISDSVLYGSGASADNLVNIFPNANDTMLT